MNHASTSVDVAERVKPGGNAQMRLRENWLALARLMGLALALLSVCLYITSIGSALAHHNLFCTSIAAACFAHGQLSPSDVRQLEALGLSTTFSSALTIGMMFVLACGYWLIAAFLFWRKPNDPLALLAGVFLALFPIGFEYGLTSVLPDPWWLLANMLSFVGSLSLVLFGYVFPSGHFVPRWTRGTMVVAFLYWGLNEFVPNPSINPFFRFQILNGLTYVGLLITVIVAQVYRYRSVSSSVQRLQTKWVIYGYAIGLGGYVAMFNIAAYFPMLLSTGPLVIFIKLTSLYTLLLVTPLTFGLAIVRSRLWDIDLVISRTLVYGILTVCVAGMYVLVVGLLGALAGTSGNLLISLVAAGLVAVLFQPLRERLQRGVNHLLYGQRDEPYAVVTQLSQRLETTLAPDAVLSTVVETVAQALKLPYAAILLKQGESYALAASTGELAGDPLVLPLVYQSEPSGQLHLAPRAPGEAFTTADRRLLDELARQAGFAAHAVRLNTDLQRSNELLEQRVAERTRELSTLLDISHTVASTLHVKPLLGLILDQLKLVIEYSGSSILTLEEDHLLFLDHRGPVSQAQLARLVFPLEHLGSLWQTIAAGEPVFVANICEETALAQALRAAMGELRTTTFDYVRSWMGVPLRLHDQVMGMLVVASREADAFTPHHATLAQAVANQASVAIENARLYEQAQELAAVEERQRLARELHDSVSQALYGMALGMHTARIQLDRDPGELPHSLDYLLSLAEAALDEMRALIFELRPESLESEGLVAALAKQGAALKARHDLIIEMDLCDEPSLPLATKQELYRIAQEALQNTVKHANARHVDLVLRQANAVVVLEIGDDGTGFDPQTSFPGHLGLRSMRERVATVSGSLHIESAPGQGTRLVAQIPTA